MTARITYTTQTGKPGSCFLAQIFDAAGRSMATIDAMPEPDAATERARRMAACWNKLEIWTTEEIESGVASLMSMDEYVKKVNNHNALVAQRDELLAVLQDLARDYGSISMDDDLKDRALATIAKFTNQQPVQASTESPAIINCPGDLPMCKWEPMQPVGSRCATCGDEIPF